MADSASCVVMIADPSADGRDEGALWQELGMADSVSCVVMVTDPSADGRDEGYFMVHSLPCTIFDPSIASRPNY